jgi:hypothetical protein
MKKTIFPKIHLTAKAGLASICIFLVTASYATIRISPSSTINNILILFFSIILVSLLSGINLRKLSHFNLVFLFLFFHFSALSLMFNPRFYVGVLPYTGLLFSRQRFFVPEYSFFLTRAAIFFAGCFSSFIFYLQITTLRDFYGFVSGVNGNSIVIIFLMISELILCGKVTFLHLPLILFSILILGNNSALFLLFAMPWPLVPEVFVFGAAVFALLLSLGFLPMDSVYSSNALLKVSSFTKETLFNDVRGTYILHFLEEFEFKIFISHDNAYLLQTFPQLPVGGSGYINPHNSFIQLILRDKLLGILSTFIWFSCLPAMPARIWIAITGRACFDSFFVGGPLDILLFYFIGTRSLFVMNRKARSSSIGMLELSEARGLKSK